MADPTRDSTNENSGVRCEPSEVPRHVAIIMDGNGRWARRQGLVRFRGHEQGADSLRGITRHCRALGIREVTFYALSTENYTRRPPREINFLMGLLKKFLVGERPEMAENDIRLKTIGDVESFSPDVLAELRESERLTAGNESMVLRLALNYGARQEIIRAIGKIVDAVNDGDLTREQAKSLGEADLTKYFYDSEMTDPDLLIRTAGEYRLSNFLLWQCSYAELWVTETLWPDFGVSDFNAAVESFLHRERKYGAVGDRSTEVEPSRR